MLTIEQLQSVAVTVTPLALDIYDKESAVSLLPLISQVHPAGGHRKGKFEWWAAFPEMRLWMDEKQVQKAFRDDLEYEVEPYEITMAFDRYMASFDDGVVKAQQLGSKIAVGFANGKVLAAYAPMRDNVATYDGQDFFDTDHTHPDGSSYSNVVTASRTAAATPTIIEARAELKKAQSLLLQNSIVRNSLVSTAQVKSGLVVIAKSYDVWAAYNDLLEEEKVGTDTNRFRGAFQLLRDFSPASGTANYVDIVLALPNGPRPTITVVHQEPTGMKFDLSKEFSKREIPFGMEAAYDFIPAFPQAAVRVTAS